MIRFRFLFAIANHIFQRPFNPSLRQPSSQPRFAQPRPCKRNRMGQGALIATTLLLLGSQPAMADATVLSFDLDGDLKQHEASSYRDADLDTSLPSSTANRSGIHGAATVGITRVGITRRIISAANGSQTEVEVATDSAPPSTEPAQTITAQQPPSHPTGSAGSISLQLQLPQSGLVAAAPLAISQSIEQLSQDFLDPSLPAQEPSAPSLAAPQVEHQPSQKAQTSAAAEAPSSSVEIPETWWHQGAESPIAVAIGTAEGTRRADGSKTTAYYWHVDPGNGADNFGTFSYQHFPASMTITVQRQATTIGKREAAAQAQLPEMADYEQMKRLRNFYNELQAQAAAHNLQLSQIEIMNGLDLANQSEAAALSVEGYIDRLAQMKGLEENVEEQILEARSWSYWDPDRRHWNAPGLGNNYDSVRRDQERRYEAIRQALATYAPEASGSRQASRGQSREQSILQSSAKPAAMAGAILGDAIANRIIDFNLPS